VIVTNTGLEPAARLAVLLHEAGHAALRGELQPGEYRAHRGLCETEAESTAFVLGNLLGLNTDASSVSYIVGWSQTDPAVIAAAATNVLRAVNIIAAGLGLHDAEGESLGGSSAASANDWCGPAKCAGPHPVPGRRPQFPLGSTSATGGCGHFAGQPGERVTYCRVVIAVVGAVARICRVQVSPAGGRWYATDVRARRRWRSRQEPR